MCRRNSPITSAEGNRFLHSIHPEGDIRKLLDETGAGYWADSKDPEAINTLLTCCTRPSALRGHTSTTARQRTALRSIIAAPLQSVMPRCCVRMWRGNPARSVFLQARSERVLNPKLPGKCRPDAA